MDVVVRCLPLPLLGWRFRTRLFAFMAVIAHSLMLVWGRRCLFACLGGWARAGMSHGCVR
eukprot:5837694-Alexandrium_andersonii.AAC.1